MSATNACSLQLLRGIFHGFQAKELLGILTLPPMWTPGPVACHVTRESRSSRARVSLRSYWPGMTITTAAQGGLDFRHADARTACDARNSVANGAACVPACVSLPLVDTKNSTAAVGGRGSGTALGFGGRGGAPAQLLRRNPSCSAAVLAMRAEPNSKASDFSAQSRSREAWTGLP